MDVIFQYWRYRRTHWRAAVAAATLVWKNAWEYPDVWPQMWQNRFSFASKKIIPIEPTLLAASPSVAMCSVWSVRKKL